MWDCMWLGLSLMTMPADSGELGVVKDAAIGIDGGKFAYLGSREGLPDLPKKLAAEVKDAGGAWASPILIDCHTHLVYGGNRASEFQARLEGLSYAEIARRGGGILSTVQATRSVSEEDLLRAASARMECLMAEGVGFVEIKSGYGLDLATELKMLRVARKLGEIHPVRVLTTFLGAHALPPEFSGRPDDYIRLVCEEMLPRVAEEGLADAVDVFCEKIAFSIDQTRRVFEAAEALGLPVKLHAEQLSDSGGAALAAESGALSADHLEYLSEAGARAMADAGTTAVLLPGAFYYLREERLPPIDLLRRLEIPIALATDSNPGSSPVLSPLLILNMACVLFGLRVDEVLRGMTINAAGALGIDGEAGSLQLGRDADFLLWDIESPADLAYIAGGRPLRSRVQRGIEIAIGG